MMKSPLNGRAFMNFGLTRMARESLSAIGYFVRGEALSPHDADIEWLPAEERTPEAFDMARKGLGLDPHDLAAHRTILEAIARQHQWIDLKRAASETLRLFPIDPDGTRALLVAQAGINQVAPAEALAGKEPSVDH